MLRSASASLTPSLLVRSAPRLGQRQFSVVNIGSNDGYTQWLTAHKDSPAVVYFTAAWCGPCKQVSPIYEKMSEPAAYGAKIAFAKVDVDDLPDVARAAGITAMPTFQMHNCGKMTGEIVGADLAKLSAGLQGLQVVELQREKQAQAEGRKDLGSKGVGGRQRPMPGRPESGEPPMPSSIPPAAAGGGGGDGPVIIHSSKN